MGRYYIKRHLPHHGSQDSPQRRKEDSLRRLIDEGIDIAKEQIGSMLRPEEAHSNSTAVVVKRLPRLEPTIVFDRGDQEVEEGRKLLEEKEHRFNVAMEGIAQRWKITPGNPRLLREGPISLPPRARK